MQEAMKRHPDLIVFREDVGLMSVALADKDILLGCASRAEATKRLCRALRFTP